MSKVGGDEGQWLPALPDFPHVATAEVQGMIDKVRAKVEGFGVKGDTFVAMCYWVRESPEGKYHCVQVRLSVDLFTFVEVFTCKKTSKTDLVKMQPSLCLSPKGKGTSSCPLEPRMIPIPTPDPCLLGLGPCS